MATLISAARVDMPGLFGGYRTLPDSASATGTTELTLGLAYPGGYYPEMSVTLRGTGFAFGAGMVPLSGTVSQIEVVLDRFHPDRPGFLLDGIGVPLAGALPAGPGDSLDAAAIFGRLLGGDDTFGLGSGSIGYGDLDVAEGLAGVLGSDRMTLTGTDGILWGDAQVIRAGTDATGGNDMLFATGTSDRGLRMVGDAQGMTGGALTGGADLLQNGVGGTAFARDLLVGDVEQVSGDATLTGGADTLIGAARLPDLILGEARGIYDARASIIAADDLIKGRGGDDLLYGDVDLVQGGTLTPGNDTILAGSGNDVVYGDYARLTGGTLLGGGDDLLYGGPGNDALLGQDGNDTLRGGSGADTLLGEAGRDTLMGGSGNDLIYGGDGADRLNGDSGADTFLFRTAEETGARGARDVIVKFQSGSDVLDLAAAARTSETGGLRWVGTDYAQETGTIGYVQIGSRLKLLANLDGDPLAELVILVGGASELTAADLILG